MRLLTPPMLNGRIEKSCFYFSSNIPTSLNCLRLSKPKMVGIFTSCSSSMMQHCTMFPERREYSPKNIVNTFYTKWHMPSIIYTLPESCIET
ncbi:UNVERIFIED_CONTAM: hypothetical protein GTU68_001911 [Idotea baltica]|nr:hypothetical protein [Idotea baltica]